VLQSPGQAASSESSPQGPPVLPSQGRVRENYPNPELSIPQAAETALRQQLGQYRESSHAANSKKELKRGPTLLNLPSPQFSLQFAHQHTDVPTWHVQHLSRVSGSVTSDPSVLPTASEGCSEIKPGKSPPVPQPGFVVAQGDSKHLPAWLLSKTPGSTSDLRRVMFLPKATFKPAKDSRRQIPKTPTVWNPQLSTPQLTLELYKNRKPDFLSALVLTA